MRQLPVWLLLLAAAAPALSSVEAPVLLDEQAFGVVRVEGDFDRVVVTRVKGTVNIQHGDTADEVRFSSYGADPRREPLPIAVWSEGKTLRFEPGHDASAKPYALDIVVPDGLDVTLDLEGTKVDVAALPKGLDVKGKGLELKVAGVRGKAVLDLVGGTAVLGGVEKRLEVRGRDTDLTLTDSQSEVALRLVGGKARVAGAVGGLQADTQGTALKIEASTGMTVKATGGRVDLAECADAELFMAGAQLTMTRVRGFATIETDSDVKFTDTSAAIRLSGSGGSVRGSGTSGLVEIKARDAQVSLERVTGELRIEGEGLKVQLMDLASEGVITVQRSDVDTVGNQRSLNIDATDGNVNVRASLARVAIRAVGGTVALVDLRASVELHADVGDVEVSFAVLPSDEDSVLQNTGGGLQVRFPGAGSCRVEARSKGGTIVSELEGVVLNPEGTTATGLVGTGGGKTINLEAGWNIRLTEGELSAPPR